jgi:transposase
MSTKEAQRPGLVRAARDGKITNREGAAALGLSVRQFRRLRRRFEEGGTRALLHRGRGRPSWRRIPESLRSRVARLLQGRYAGFNDCHLAEVLREREHIAISRATGMPPDSLDT